MLAMMLPLSDRKCGNNAPGLTWSNARTSAVISLWSQ
jgi:hypothetical protein